MERVCQGAASRLDSHPDMECDTALRRDRQGLGGHDLSLRIQAGPQWGHVAVLPESFGGLAFRESDA